ncbi:MAG: DinB family protein [Ktedonobacterales bacterium]
MSQLERESKPRVVEDQVVRSEVLHLLKGGNAHMTFEEAVKQFPVDRINSKFPNGTYTSWHLLEHIRLAQRDILDFIVHPDYQEKEWPRDFWPPQNQEASEQDWQQTIASFEADAQALQSLAGDLGVDLYAPIPHGSGQTILRELLLVADHNAYHIGEFAIARQMMGTWDKDHS